MPRYDAVVFDLLTALIDSWSLWNDVAGTPERGFAWRRRYLALTYGCGGYRPYEELVAEAAADTGLPASAASTLDARWTELQPWEGVAALLTDLGCDKRLGIATNCSRRLGNAAAAQTGGRFDVVVTAEDCGFYKPRPEPYLAVLAALGTAPDRTLFVAGSASDVPGAMAVGMPVYWHNRIGLKAPPGAPQPLIEATTLDALPALARA